MLEPFIWMFKNKKFYIHYVYILFFCIIFSIVATFLFYMQIFNENLTVIRISKIISYALYSIIILFCLGYFWNLTDSIIQRKYKIESSNIYSGKIKKIGIIEIPNIAAIRLIWRGVASIFASIILSIPFILMVLHNIHNYETTVDFFNFNKEQANTYFNIIYVFISSFIPALAWNYAKADSVTAVLNLPKAVFIMGNYTLKYIYNTILFIITTGFILFLITKLFNINNINTLYNINSISLNYPNLIYFGIILIASIYIMYVNAYLLGTITPPGEDY